MQNIKRIIKEKGYKIKDVEQKLGCGKGWLSNKIHCNAITLPNVRKIAEAIGVQPYEFFLPPDKKVVDKPVVQSGVSVCPHCLKPIKVEFENIERHG